MQHYTEPDIIQQAKASAVSKINWTAEAKNFAGQNWHKLTGTEKDALINEIKKNWFNY